MANIVDLTGQVAIVTGAGGGLGREHALELARRGARVIVNDLGTTLTGEGRSSDAADKVVAEIKAAGGDAVANGGSVTSTEDMAAMADQALAAFGRIDILIANAGFLRDTSFRKMAPEQFDAVVAVHLTGTQRTTQAVWNTMIEAGYGRIVFTVSTAGLFGNFGQSNYGAAKMGLVGLMNTLNIEGRKADIRVNCISPFAATRMSEAHLPADVADAMHPRHVSPGVAYLAGREAPSGVILNAGAGMFSTSLIVETLGVTMPLDQVSAESIAAAWERISDREGAQGFASANDQADQLLERVRACLG